ncbi:MULTISPECIES: hypothetical protein [unclassified Microbacterium]|uniref:hypothetical protein n=1 Tax=unclassified Microbacterium TaxID=2609290 RepID=UPI00214B3CFA|nr:MULTISPECIES: hypothetical protein [unclassified Microbacterium]MCR2809149.1 hypothetical protein [Microbacterium sp. zg.B185]WIM20301.1 hypothetical protein QNO12_05720 [Microbacterium sp. zg-B185]
MNALQQAAVAAPTPIEVPNRRLRVVEEPSRRRRPKLIYGVVALVGALTIGAAQMGLSILTMQSSYELSALTQESRELTWKKQILYDEVAGLGSPQYLAANASALGMVINESPSYLRLSDGALLGAGQVSLGTSSVDAIGRAAVPNALITDTPLVTAPGATIEGAPVAPEVVVTDDGVSNTPPPLTDGLPTPSTH